MEPNVFLGYPTRSIACVLNTFKHQQYPSNSVDPWCFIIEYHNEGIGFLVSFGRVMQYPPCFKRYVMELNVFMGYPKKSIACSLNFLKHEQYPSNSLDQNNSAHGVYNVPQ
jgi:hypothetical protein